MIMAAWRAALARNGAGAFGRRWRWAWRRRQAPLAHRRGAARWQQDYGDGAGAAALIVIMVKISWRDPSLMVGGVWNLKGVGREGAEGSGSESGRWKWIIQSGSGRMVGWAVVGGVVDVCVVLVSGHSRSIRSPSGRGILMMLEGWKEEGDNGRKEGDGKFHPDRWRWPGNY